MKSVYIHIPFCDNICSYCDFCKLKYNKEWVYKYLLNLDKEINECYKGEKIRTLFIGGGTPTILNIEELNILFNIINKFDLSELEEFTVECNVESLTSEKLILFKKNGVNRISIGVETFNEKFLNILNRHHTSEEVFECVNDAKAIGFDNINIDLMYALPSETMEDLERDIDNVLKLNVSHISCYSLMIEEHTKLYIDNYSEIDEDLDYEMYSYIEKRLTNREYKHYEISNYAKENMESKHNLVYWHNECYYGFGLGASGYLDTYRYDNTKNINKYFENNYVANIEPIDDEKKKKYELMLGFRVLDGINKSKFYDKFGVELRSIEEINKMISEGMLGENDEYIYIEKDWIYKSNEILVRLL